MSMISSKLNEFKKKKIKEKINKIDDQRYYELLTEIINNNKRNLLDHIYYIVMRKYIVFMINKKDIVPAEEYLKFNYYIYNDLSKKILTYEKENDNWIEDFNLDELIEKYYQYSKDKYYLENIKVSLLNFYAIEYLYLRITDEERISLLFDNEVSLLFDIKEKDKLDSIRTIAVSKARKNNFVDGFNRGLLERIARKYLSNIKGIDGIKYKLFEDLCSDIGFMNFGKFIITYGGSQFIIPPLEDLVKDIEDLT